MDRGHRTTPPKASTSKPSPSKSLKELKRRRKAQGTTPEETEVVTDVFKTVTSFWDILFKGTGVAFELESEKHKCEYDPNYPECPARLQAILDRCNDLGLISRCKRINFEIPDIQEKVLTMHSEGTFNRLREYCTTLSQDEMEEKASLYDAIYFNEHTFKAACDSLKNVLNIVQAIAEGHVTNGIALVRPPGHHAMKDKYCGYCYFNNVGIAANMCIDKGWAKKVLIVDFDVHHGQATQQMFYDRSDVLYFSIHRYQFGTFWPNLCESNFHYVGTGKGKGFNINVPLNEIKLSDDDYLAIVFAILLPVATEFNPDFILVSAGYDAALGCPELPFEADDLIHAAVLLRLEKRMWTLTFIQKLFALKKIIARFGHGEMEVTPGFYAHLITLLSGLAKGKLAVCLEGGYFLPSLAEGVAMTLKALLGDPCPVLEPVKGIKPSVLETIHNVRAVLCRTWRCFKVCPRAVLSPDERTTKERIFRCDCKPATAPFATRDCYPSADANKDEKNRIRIEKLRSTYLTVRKPVCYTTITDQRMLNHAPKPIVRNLNYRELPERLARIQEVFNAFGFEGKCKVLPEAVVRPNWFEYGPHSEDYVKALIPGEFKDTNELYMNISTPHSIDVAVSSLLDVVDEVMMGNVTSGVAIIRPPGHHADRAQAQGYCFVNNIAVAANYLLRKYEQKKIVIVDFDVHHGNGTQNIFFESNEVMYISIHRYDHGHYFPSGGNGGHEHCGHGSGKGYNVNIPFNDKSMGDSEYMSAFHNIILPVMYSFGPEVVLVSAGFDAGICDPLGHYKVRPETFGQMVHLLKPLASGKLILSLEGGYNWNTTANGLAMCVQALLGNPIPMPDKLYDTFSEGACKTLQEVQQTFKMYWPVLELGNPIPRDQVSASWVHVKGQSHPPEYYEGEVFKKFYPDIWQNCGTCHVPP